MYLPVLSHFQNGNVWTGSLGALRYRLAPDSEDETMTAQVWQGPWCLEDSAVEISETFPLAEEEDLLPIGRWLEGWGEEMARRPQESMAESVARRDRVRAEKAAAKQ